MEDLGGPRRTSGDLGGPWRTSEDLGGPWRTLEDLGGAFLDRPIIFIFVPQNYFQIFGIFNFFSKIWFWKSIWYFMTKYKFSTFWNFLPLFHSCILLCIVNVESSTKMTSLMMIIALDSNPILGQALRMFNTVMVYVSTYNWISKKSMKKKSACPSISSGKDLSSWSQIFSRLLFHVKKWKRYSILRQKQIPVSGTRSRQFFFFYFFCFCYITWCLFVHCVRLLEGWLQDALLVA